jgi:hypothetical protein
MGHAAEFLVMQYERPGGSLLPIAILLLDPAADKLHIRGRDNFEGIAEGDEAELLELFIVHLSGESEQRSGSAIVRELEDTLSNNVRITERRCLRVDDVHRALADLYHRHVAQ